MQAVLYSLPEAQCEDVSYQNMRVGMLHPNADIGLYSGQEVLRCPRAAGQEGNRRSCFALAPSEGPPFDPGAASQAADSAEGA